MASFREVSVHIVDCVATNRRRYGFSYDNYTSLWNVLDYCAVTVPVTQVSLVDDMKPQHEARNETEADIWQNCKSRQVLVVDDVLMVQQICLKYSGVRLSRYSLLVGD